MIYSIFYSYDNDTTNNYTNDTTNNDSNNYDNGYQQQPDSFQYDTNNGGGSFDYGGGSNDYGGGGGKTNLVNNMYLKFYL
jgi:hypothetical protein